VFSWSVCPFAQRAQRVLREAGAKFVAIELDQVPDGKAIKAELGFLTGKLGFNELGHRLVTNLVWLQMW